MVIKKGNIDLMAEFKFSCPQCRQQIQCDSTYVGSQINCPLCRQTIIFPPVTPSAAPPGERIFQIKASTLQTLAILGLSVLLAAGIVLLTVHLLAGPKTVTFKAFVDGVDVVKLSGKNLWVEHQDDQLPSRMSINGKKWNPVWDKNTSASYVLKPVFKPHDPERVRLTKCTGRGSLSIVEKPTAENGGTLAIKVDDGGIGGADWYEFTVLW
jgi:DNA-directed RNA polymerase subunit RPC12/RpoP